MGAQRTSERLPLLEVKGAAPLPAGHSAQTSVPATCIGAYSVPTPGFLCCHIQSKQAQDVSTIAFYSSTFERTECQSKRGVCPRLTLRGELGF